MKTFTNSFFKKGVLVASCIAIFSNADAGNTFTAFTSGNFSSTSTWMNGLMPTVLGVGDQIIVNAGVTLTLDQNVDVTPGSSLTIFGGGTVIGNTGKYISLEGTLAGAGTLTIDSMALNMGSTIAYTGTVTAQRLSSMGTNIASSAAITVSNTLYLLSSNYNQSAGSLTMSNGATIIENGGSMMISGTATLTSSGSYNVRYLTSGTTGSELSGSGLGTVEVNSGASSTVMLNNDLNVTGTLMLTSGTLDLNNHNLTFSSNGSFSASGTGTITSSSASNLTFATSGNFTNGLRFTSGSNTVNNLTVNLGNNTSSVTLGGNLNVGGTLNLQSGMLNVGTNNLMLSSGATISGGSANSYVATGVGGMLTMNLAAGGTNTYQVGTMTHYAPVVLKANSGSASGDVSVSVNDHVMANGTTGSNLSSDALVDATWYVSSTATSNINLNMQVMWSANMEINSFDRTKAYISHYTNGSWDATTSASATTSGSMYVLSRNNITSLSPFAVMNKFPSSVANVENESAVTVYPNPVTDMLHIKGANINTVNIYDVTGHLVKSAVVTNNTISVSELPAGYYNVRISGTEFSAVQHFVKQ